VKVFAKAASISGVAGHDGDSLVDEVENARLRKKASQRWGGSDIRSRSGGGSGWTIDGSAPVTPMTPYTPPTNAAGYINTPVTAAPMSGRSTSYPNGLAPANVPLPNTSLPNTPASTTFPPNGQTPSYPYANGRSNLGNGYPSAPSTPMRMDAPQTQTPPMLSPSPYSVSANGSSTSLRPKSNLIPSNGDKRLD